MPLADFQAIVAIAHRAKKYDIAIDERGHKGKAPVQTHSREYGLSISRSPLIQTASSRIVQEGRKSWAVGSVSMRTVQSPPHSWVRHQLPKSAISVGILELSLML